jgi:uncharacterized protein YjbI with pentapeptide repeats
LQVLKRWAAWPRGNRWLAVIAAVVLVLAIVWVLLWVLFVAAPDWLAHHDVGSAKGPLLQTSRDAARGRLLTLAAGGLAAGALVFTALNLSLLRRNSEQADQWQRRTHELTEQGQVTDRYTKAIEQLGSDKLDVRIGGIYALERIARDSARDHPTAMEVLAAFIRVHSHEQWPPPEPGNDAIPLRTTRPDVQAAVTVIGRRDSNSDRRPIDLTRADLSRADLTFADLNYADLNYADLAHADLNYARLGHAHLNGVRLNDARLSCAHLNGAHLTGAHLNHAELHSAQLNDAYLQSAQLNDARLNDAQLNDAYLKSAQLNGANLGRAQLNRASLDAALLNDANLAGAQLNDAYLNSAHLNDANLAGAQLSGADLSGAHLDGTILDSANLTGARWPEDAPVPEGWKLDTGSGRLTAADTGAETAEAN